jgi:hypothetical protein
MLRGIVFLALVGGAGFSAWTSFQDSSRNPLDWAIGEVHAMVTQHEAKVIAASELQPLAAKPGALQAKVDIPDDRFTISKETLAAITCGPWDVSEDGIEAILQEMIRRGWTPPSGAKALEASRENGGVAQAVSPDAPAPTIQSPVLTAETHSSADTSVVEASSF